MKVFVITAVLLLAPAIAPGAPDSPGTPVSAGRAHAERGTQDPIADNRPEIKTLLEQLGTHIAKKGAGDSEAIAVLDKLHEEFPKSGPKDRAAIVKGLDRCFEVKRQESEEGVRDNKLFLAAAVCLRDMGPESAPVLMSWIGNKSHKKDLALQQKLIQSLGKTKDEKGREVLIKLLVDKSPQIQAAASEALGEYVDADQKVRKENFERLLQLVMEVKNTVDTNANDTIARERYDTISAPIITSLQRLSKHEEHDAQKWQAWWNDNKKKDWDKSDG
jgi:hypothetical protein